MKTSSFYPSVFGIIVLLLWLLPFFWSGWTKRTVPLLPKSVSFQYSAAGLFTNRSTRWWDHHLEVQAADDARHELAERAVFPMGAFGYRTRYDRILNESNRSWMSGEIRQRLAEHVVRKAGLGEQGVRPSRPHLEGETPSLLGRADDAGRSGRAPLAGRGEGADGRAGVPTVLFDLAGRGEGADGRAGVPTVLLGAKALRLVRTVWPVGNEVLALPEGEWNPPPVPEVPAAFRQVLGTYKLVGGQVIEVPRKAPAPTVVRRPARPPAGPGGPIRPRLPVVVRPLLQRGGGTGPVNVQPEDRAKK